MACRVKLGTFALGVQSLIYIYGVGVCVCSGCLTDKGREREKERSLF